MGIVAGGDREAYRELKKRPARKSYIPEGMKGGPSVMLIIIFLTARPLSLRHSLCILL